MEQKVINLEAAGGEYYNFFYTPGSLGSLATYIDLGWIVKFIKDDGKKAMVLLEREK